MTEQDNKTAPNKQKRERSPNFPFIPLGKALERIKAMEEKHKQFPTAPETLAGTWSLTPKSSSFLQTISAVKAFGLLEDSGRGAERRLKVSDLARRILVDAREGPRDQAIREAATKPKLLREFYAEWGSDRPHDDHCMSVLQLDHKFRQDSAENFLRVFDETFRFAPIGDVDKIADKGEDANTKENGQSEEPAVEVGQYVQWESQGQLQFPSPRRITRIEHDDDHGWYVWVEGSASGIPMNEVVAAQPGEKVKAQSGPPVRTTDVTDSQISVERATLPLPEGVAALEFPSSMSEASFDDFVAWVEVIKKRAGRGAK